MKDIWLLSICYIDCDQIKHLLLHFILDMITQDKTVKKLLWNYFFSIAVSRIST
jgi:hypothetical protein